MAAKEDLEKYEDNFETSTAGEMFKLPNRSRSRTSLSLFELVLDVVPAKKNEKTAYEEQLHKEACEWNNLLKTKLAEVVAGESANVVIDKSILTAAQLARINHGQELAAQFTEQAAEFWEKSTAFLEEHNELVEIHTDIKDLCKSELDKIAFDVIYDGLYKKSKINLP